MSPLYRIRPARIEDQALIRQVIRREAGLDPTDLRWENFLLAETETGDLAGLGQIRRSPRCKELGSLYVREQHQGKGLGARLIAALIEQEPGDLYLECQARMVPYYQRFGFREIPARAAPPPLRSKAMLGGWVARLFGARLAVMRLER